MDPLQGTAFFPGVNQVIAASITLRHGISPSVATLTMVPQADFDTEVGTLVFTFGGVTISLVDCRVDYGSVERTSGGEICRVSLLDRRWRWQFGKISGTYNVWRDNFSLERGENGTIDTERTPQELAGLCLEAMGESDFDVGDLPNDSRPSVEWDFNVPAKALVTLCDELGCRIILGLDNRVTIRRVGEGEDLPPGDFLQNSVTVDQPNRPDAIAVVCGPNRYQVDFQLEAVGLEEGDEQSDDTLRPIDELSYKPPGGWSHVDLPYLHQVDPEFKALAQRSVFKYYRIKTPVVVPGYDGPLGSQVNLLAQILPIEDEQVLLASENGQLASLPASVFGVWFPEGDDMANTTVSLQPAPQPDQADRGSALPTVYGGRFRIDKARGLVIFDEPVYRNVHPSATGGSGYEVVIGPAELVLRAACAVRDPITMELERYTRQRLTGSSFGTSSRYLKHKEIVLTHVPRYTASYAVFEVQANAAEVDQMADDYLDAAAQEYETRVPRTVRYAGLVPINPDGAIQQVAFHVGGGGATTTASRHTEHHQFTRPYARRRRLERQGEVEDAASVLSPRNIARWLKTNLYTKPRP